MPDIRIHVRTETGATHAVDAASEITAGHLIRELIEARVIPETDSEGRRISWTLVDEGSARTLEDAKTLQENGVGSGHHLHARRQRPEDVVICKACGFENSRVAQFCRKCGASLVPPPPEKKIRLDIHTQDGNTDSVETAPGIMTEEFINGLVNRLGLPTRDSTGHKIKWILHDEETARTLKPEKSMEENGVLEGHHLWIRRELSPESFWTRVWRWIRKSRWILAPAGIALVAAFVVWIVLNRRITVEIRTLPPGAKIRINNNDYGISPVKAKLRKGTYRVEATKNGYEDTAETLDLKRGSPAIDIALTPIKPPPPPAPQPRLWLSTNLSGGTVQFDHEPPEPISAGGAFERPHIADGSHTVAFSGADGQAVTFALGTTAGAAPVISNAVAPNSTIATFVIGGKGRALVQYSSQQYMQVSLQPDNGPSQTVSPPGLDIPNLADGDHVFVFTTGGQQWTVPVTVGPTPALAVFIERISNVGTLVVRTPGVDQAQVFLNNVLRGSTLHGKLSLSNLPPGGYTIRIVKQGYDSVSAIRHVQVAAGTSQNVTFTLHAVDLFAALRIQGAVPGSRVFIDGNLAGLVDFAGTFARTNVSLGSHTIRLEYTQYQPYQVQMHFAAGEAVTVSAHQQGLGLVMLNTAPNPISMTYHLAGETQDHAVQPGAVWLSAGSYTFTAYWSNSRKCSKPAVVTPGGQVMLNFHPSCK